MQLFRTKVVESELPGTTPEGEKVLVRETQRFTPITERAGLDPSQIENLQIRVRDRLAEIGSQIGSLQGESDMLQAYQKLLQVAAQE